MAMVDEMKHWKPRTAEMAAVAQVGNEERELSWRQLAAYLGLMLTLPVVPIALVVLWPAPVHPAHAAERSEIKASTDSRETNVATGKGDPAGGPGTDSGEEEVQGDSRSSLPDPRQFLGDALRSIWEQSGEAPTGVRWGVDAASARESLLLASPGRPSDVEVVSMPHPGTSGLFTLRLNSDGGRDGILGVRLVRTSDKKTPWELESVVVLQPAH